MSSINVEPSSDPNGVTITFFDRSSVTYILREGRLIRLSIELPAHRSGGNPEDEFGKRNLARAEKAALEHFEGKTTLTYESLLKERAAEFASYLHKTNAMQGDKSLYTQTALLEKARKFLSTKRWDLDAQTLVSATRAYWVTLAKDKRDARRAQAPDKERKRIRREWLARTKAAQQDLFTAP